MHSLYRIQLLALLIASLVSSFPRTADADDSFQVRIGFDGSYKVGRWTSIEVDSLIGPHDSATCEVIVPDADGNATIVPLTLVSASADGMARYAGTFRCGRLNAPIRVRLGEQTQLYTPSDDETHETGIHPARESVQFLGALGHDETIAEAAILANTTADGVESRTERARVIHFFGWDSLPATDNGWDALDVLFVSDRFPDTNDQSEDLRNWVRRGGHLVLSIGAHGDAFRSSPLANWVPSGIGDVRTVVELAIVADRVPGAPMPPVAGGIAAAALDAGDGVVLLSSFEGPLATRCAYGVGRVTVFALDHTASPLNEWDGTAQFCLFLADVDVSPEGESQSRLRSSGISDLATQMVSNLDWFPDVEKPSYGTVLTVVLCFLIFVGPVDYFLVHRLFKRPRRTWVTFPVAVVVAAGCGAVVARQTHPQQPLMNQFEIVDIDVSLSTTHVQSWVTVYSPTTRRYPVVLTLESWIADDEDTAPRVTWTGKPESGFRGMYRNSGLDFGSAEYEFGPQCASVDNLPIDQWSTKSLHADWERVGDVPVQSNLVNDGSGELTGSLTHQLPGPIENWILAYGGYAYLAGNDPTHISIAPGIPFEPSEVMPVPRILQRILIGHHHVTIHRGDSLGSESSPSRRTYDPLNRDPLDLIRTITFYNAAGGRDYTELTNASFSRSDFSSLLPLHRAVLLGRVGSPAVRSTLGEEAAIAESSTFIRIILPVEPASSIDAD